MMLVMAPSMLLMVLVHVSQASAAQPMQVHHLHIIDKAGWSENFSVQLPPEACVQDLETFLYENRPYATSELFFMNGVDKLQPPDLIPADVVIHRLAAPKYILISNVPDLQITCEGTYARQDDTHDGRVHYKLKRNLVGETNVESRHLKWSNKQKAWIVADNLQSELSYIRMLDPVRCPTQSESNKWTCWNAGWHDCDAHLFVAGSLRSAAPPTIVVTHSDSSKGLYQAHGTRNGRPFFVKMDAEERRELYWNKIGCSWQLGSTSTEEPMYSLLHDVPCPTQSNVTWLAVCKECDNSRPIRVWSPAEHSRPGRSVSEALQLSGAIAIAEGSASVFVHDLQRASLCGSHVVIPIELVKPLLLSLARSGLTHKADEPLEHKLQQIIGQHRLKQQLRRLYTRVKWEKKTGGEAKAPHMAFLGNPGTGKTTIAQMLGQLLRDIGVLRSGHVHVVQRSDLVAEYIGHTGTKTQAAIAKAKGGILLVDEAYQLIVTGSRNDFGTEALEELMRAMDPNADAGFVIIFAGYPADMERFIKVNEGLARRVERLHFDDYSENELAMMLLQKLQSSGLTTDITEEQASEYISQIPESIRSKYNGGLVQQLLEKAKDALAEEFHTFSDQAWSKHKLRHLNAKHFEFAKHLFLQSST